MRRVSYGIGVERTFPMHGPRVDPHRLSVTAKVRRAKLVHYLRDRVGKASKLKGR